jgi:serine/threonine protein kinase
MPGEMDGGSRYRILRRLGSGGMAEVLEGVATGAAGFERRVAIKRMLPSSALNTSLTGMFLDEARIASHLHHANIVSILDFGVVDGVPFQALELVDGLNGHQVVERIPGGKGGLPAALALFICTEVGHALEYAHGASDASGAALGIVHRDVKPSNILVSWNGEVKLSDFGIAFARDRAEPTLDGVAKGTPLFMAPEQLTRTRVDARTDLFALGCVLHALIAGSSPLSSGHLVNLLGGRPLPAPMGFDDDVGEIIARSTRPAPADRYPDAGEMTRALGAALARRLQVDPKSALRDWMSALAPAIPKAAAPAGRLDDLFNLEIVAGPGDHQFTTRASAPRSRERGAPRPGKRLALVAAAFGALLGVGAWGGWHALREAPPPPVIALPLAPPPTPSPPALVSPAPPLAATPEPEPPPVEHLEKHISRRPTHRESGPPELTGKVAFGGAGWIGAEIRIDGRSGGYAPKVLDVTLGKHTVDLIGTDGRHSGPGSVVVTPRDTGISPLRYPSPGARR